MQIEVDENQISKLEVVLIVGVVGCLLLATWEFGHLTADVWLREWVDQNSFTNRRIILYGIAFIMSLAALFVASVVTGRSGRFGHTVSRAFLWYGTLLLISTIAIFVFDCLPEVFAGVIGAIIFIAAIYFLQRKFFSAERVMKSRLSKNQCIKCGSGLPLAALFCTNCGTTAGQKCPNCGGYTKIGDKFCAGCGNEVGEPQPA